MTCDLLLRGGTVLDGTGQPGRTADVAITDGRVTAVEPRFSATAAGRVLDVSGAIVCPGFVDLHSHADFTVMATPSAPTQLLQGVTTLVTGNCGYSPFPLSAEHAGQTRSLSGFLDDGLSWEWTTAAEYAAAVERLPLGVNLALQVGHGALRTAVLGTDDRAPTGAELAQMCALVRQAVDDGVVGLSSGLIYPPGSYATAEELSALARAAVEAEQPDGPGLLYSTHMRSESDRLLESVDESLAVARAAGIRLQISHLKAAGAPNWGAVGAALHRIDEARDAGTDVAADQYPYSASSTTLTTVLPEWAMEGGVSALLSRLDQPTQYRRIAEELADREAAGRFRPERVVLAGMAEGPYRSFVGHSIADAAAELLVPPGEAVLDLLAAHRGQIASIHHSMSEDDVRHVMRHPEVAVASDGWILRSTGQGRPHPRSFGTFARVLGHYARNQDLLELRHAVRKMTGLPASRLGWRDRGVVRPGAVADLTVFDPAAIVDRATFDDPWQPADGVLHTLLAGALAVEEGDLTGAAAGRVLRREGTWAA